MVLIKLSGNSAKKHPALVQYDDWCFRNRFVLISLIDFLYLTVKCQLVFGVSILAHLQPLLSGYIDKNLPVLHRLKIIRKIVRYLFYSHNFMVKIKHYFKLKKYFK